MARPEAASASEKETKQRACLSLAESSELSCSVRSFVLVFVAVENGREKKRKRRRKEREREKERDER